MATKKKKKLSDGLVQAVTGGRPEKIVEQLEGGEDLEGGDALGRTVLHLAATSRSLETVKLLIERGASVTSAEHKKKTPLHYAAQVAWPEMLDALLAAGAQADAVDTYLHTALHELAAYAPTSDAGLRCHVAEKLIAAGCPVDAQARTGRTALWLAAHHGDEGLVEVLLSHSADPHLVARGEQGSPIDAARAAGHEALGKVLER